MEKMKYVSEVKAPLRSEFYGARGMATVRLGDVEYKHIGISISEEEAKQVFKELGVFFNEKAEIAEPEAPEAPEVPKLSEVEEPEDTVADMIVQEIIFGLQESQRLTKADMYEIFELTDMELKGDETATEMYRKLLDRIAPPIDAPEEEATEEATEDEATVDAPEEGE